jgi:hypothetical protein
MIDVQKIKKQDARCISMTRNWIQFLLAAVFPQIPSKSRRLLGISILAIEHLKTNLNKYLLHRQVFKTDFLSTRESVFFFSFNALWKYKKIMVFEQKALGSTILATLP